MTSVPFEPDRESARAELVYLEDLLRRARRTLDPHAFHFVHWGAIVLLWYPLGNALELAGRLRSELFLGVAAVVLGFVLSVVRELRLRRAPRVSDEDTHVTSQVRSIVFASILAGFVLSAVGPATGLIAGANVPIVWGLVYANISVMTGLVYRRDFMRWGIFIFVATIVAILFQRYDGFILGPCMGLGAIVPGLRAERDVVKESRRASEPGLGSV